MDSCSRAPPRCHRPTRRDGVSRCRHDIPGGSPYLWVRTHRNSWLPRRVKDLRFRDVVQERGVAVVCGRLRVVALRSSCIRLLCAV